MSGKVTRAEITKNHWINRDKEMGRERGLREVEEGENNWKAVVGEEEGCDKNKGRGSGRGSGRRQQEQGAGDGWRGLGKGGEGLDGVEGARER